MTQSFNTKVIISGNCIELIEYEKTIFSGRPANKKRSIKKQTTTTTVNELTVEENKKRSLRRSRTNFRRLVSSNEQLDKFFSPTFDPKRYPNTTNISYSNKLFNKFIMRLNYKYKNLAYIAVPEYQKDIDYYGNVKPNGGNIHYHFLCNLQYVPVKTLSEIWGMGGIDIEKINDIENTRLYLCKYLEKNLNDKRFCGKKKYFTSNNLRRPIELTDILAYGYINKHKHNLRLDFEKRYLNDHTGEIIHKFYKKIH